jgi:uncharacterized protein YjiS (DUF1127 family)
MLKSALSVVCQHLAGVQTKEHEVMTGSVPSITLPVQSTLGSTTAVRPTGITPPRVVVNGQIKQVGVAVVRTWHRLQHINRIWRERRLLAALDDRALKDIGLNRADVVRETSRSPIDLPQCRSADPELTPRIRRLPK